MQGAITKRMTAIEEMAGMDVLCSDKTGTLTLNKLSVDKNLIEVKTFDFVFILSKMYILGEKEHKVKAHRFCFFSGFSQKC